MNTQISTPVKVFALAALVLVLGMGAMTLMKGGDSGATAEPVTPVVHPTTPASTTAPATSTPAATTPASPAGPSTTPASTTPAAATPAATTPAATTPAATTPAHPARPTVHATSKPKAVVKPKPVHLPPVAPNGLPRALDELLHIHRVVVVAVYDGEISTDLLFLGEAQAGALDSHAGFLAVNVLNEKVAGPLTAAAGKGALLPSPGLLIYKQPDVLMNVITGFVDRAAVANAVANALVADTPNTATTPTP